MSFEEDALPGVYVCAGGSPPLCLDLGIALGFGTASVFCDSGVSIQRA